MELSPKALEELKKILKAECGVDFSNEDAQDLGVRLLRLTALVLKRKAKEKSNDK